MISSGTVRSAVEYVLGLRADCVDCADESMRQLYAGGNGAVLQVVTRWLTSASDHLHNSAALAIGNIARSGSSVVEAVVEICAQELRLVNDCRWNLNTQHNDVLCWLFLLTSVFTDIQPSVL